jgi:hypothetical protein
MSRRAGIKDAGIAEEATEVISERVFEGSK